MRGWHQKMTGWSESQKSLLSSSWRESTLKTYRPAWNRWVSWSERENVDPFHPDGSSVAKFLADLHQKENLSLSTILVHKSVIATFAEPNNKKKLSSDILVKQILKSIALAKPKLAKPPIWDTDILVEFLLAKKPNTTSLFEVSKHTAVLLLLCSGRRTHDLTLLRVSVDYCKIEDQHIVLRPIFGSKTDSAQHQQSGWKLLCNPDNTLLCPVYWVKLLINLSESRRDLAKADNLFVTVTGRARPATRTIISGWVKKVLIEAGIKATPGSFRSAVASKRWVENCQLDDILAKANWKSANTFTKFYRREIIPVSISSPSVRIASNFVPVDV